MAFPVRLHPEDPALIRALIHFSPAPRACFLSVLVGFVAVLVQLPLLVVIPFALVATIILGLPIGIILSLPVTFVVLPLAALICGEHKKLRNVVLPLVGGIAGAVFTHFVFFFFMLKYTGKDTRTYVMAGAAAGLAAGFYFAWKMRQVYNAEHLARAHAQDGIT